MGKGILVSEEDVQFHGPPSLPRSVKRFIISHKDVESPLQFFLSSAVFHVDQN